MEFYQIAVMFFATVFALCLTTGSAIKCYSCNSASMYEGKRCADPFPKDEALLVDCQSSEQNPLNPNSTYCRKQVQDVSGDYRIVRSCAYTPPDSMDCIERAGTKEISFTYCECEGEGCNTATSTTVNFFMLAVVSAILALLIQL